MHLLLTLVTDDSVEYGCAILKVLISKHRHGGSPLPKDAVISMAAVPKHDYGKAKEDFDVLKNSPDYPFVMNQGPEHVLLNNSYFLQLVDYLIDECGWTRMKIDNSLRHFDTSNHPRF